MSEMSRCSAPTNVKYSLELRWSRKHAACSSHAGFNAVIQLWLGKLHSELALINLAVV